MKQYDVIIIGAGTAGLTARREVAKKTDNYIVVDDGPLGTTCARVGCMPSKVLIQVANDYNRRKKFPQIGIKNSGHLNIDLPTVMQHVRQLRDRFVRGVESSIPSWEDKLVRKKAKFIDTHTIDLDGESVSAKKIIVATGSRPVIPGPWQQYSDFLIDTDTFFELENLPQKIAVIGLGVIGIELGQALYHLGLDVVAMTMGKEIGGLTDPKLQNYVAEKFSQEMTMHFNGANIIGVNSNGLLQIEADNKIYEVAKALIAVGRRANIDSLGIEKLNIKVNKFGIPEVNPHTMKLKEAPHIFLPGDVNADRPLLHEAADEGRIAGYNAVNDEQCFKRRIPLGITFSEPNIATVGMRFAELTEKNISFVTGTVSFEGQGRSIVKLKEQGLLHIYAQKDSGEILGAEIHAPEGEHLAHLLAWAISMKLTVFEALKMPFYHPVIEEGLRTALREAATIIDHESENKELFYCQDSPIR